MDNNTPSLGAPVVGAPIGAPAPAPMPVGTPIIGSPAPAPIPVGSPVPAPQLGMPVGGVPAPAPMIGMPVAPVPAPAPVLLGAPVVQAPAPAPTPMIGMPVAAPGPTPLVGMPVVQAPAPSPMIGMPVAAPGPAPSIGMPVVGAPVAAAPVPSPLPVSLPPAPAEDDEIGFADALDGPEAEAAAPAPVLLGQPVGAAPVPAPQPVQLGAPVGAAPVPAPVQLGASVGSPAPAPQPVALGAPVLGASVTGGSPAPAPAPVPLPVPFDEPAQTPASTTQVVPHAPEPPSPVADPNAVTVTITKAGPDSKVGIGLGVTSSGEVLITSIKPGSLAKYTALEGGMIIKSVNGVGAVSAPQTATMLKDAPGTVTIVAERPKPRAAEPEGTVPSSDPNTVTVTLQKANPDTKVGIGLGKSPGTGGVIITSIKEGGLAEGTALQNGMLIKSINGIDVTGKTPQDAVALLKDAPGSVTIVAERSSPAASAAVASAPAASTPVVPVPPTTSSDPNTVTVTLTKDSPDTKVGIGLGKSASNGEVVITSIKEGGLAEGTALEKDMQIKNINGVDITGKTPQDAVALMKEAQGSVTIVAERQAAPSSTNIVTVTLVKDSPDTKVGLSLGKSAANGEIVITNIKEGGLADGKGLKTGMLIKSVNGVNVAGKMPQDAITLLRNAPDAITIVAERPTSTSGGPATAGSPAIAARSAPSGSKTAELQEQAPPTTTTTTNEDGAIVETKNFIGENGEEIETVTTTTEKDGKTITHIKTTTKSKITSKEVGGDDYCALFCTIQ